MGGFKGVDRTVREREPRIVVWLSNCVDVGTFQTDRKCERGGGCV